MPLDLLQDLGIEPKCPVQRQLGNHFAEAPVGKPSPQVVMDPDVFKSFQKRSVGRVLADRIFIVREGFPPAVLALQAIPLLEEPVDFR